MTYSDQSISTFLSELGSNAPAPGGGSAAALVGATAAALCEMACRLTLGKEAFRESWPALQDSLSRAQALETRLRILVDDDAQAYLAVVAARAKPRDSAGQKSQRKEAIQEAVLRAASVPLETLEALRGCVRLAELLVEKGNPSCLTDVGTAGALVGAGAAAAAYNVRVNLPAIADESRRAGFAARADEALTEIENAAARIAAQVENSLGGRNTK
jgi:formiminotetrahydrofolate cyclodeaminase